MSSNPYVRWLVAISVGAVLALYAYHRVTDPEPARQRMMEEAIVMDARQVLLSYVLPGAELQFVDPLAADRKIGKTYIWPSEDGWEISGYYRRDQGDVWHPFLMSLDSMSQLKSLAVKDSNDRLIGLSAQDPLFSAVP